MPSVKYGTLLLPIHFITYFSQTGSALILAPRSTRRQDCERSGIVFDADLGDAPSCAWVDKIDQVVMYGNLITTEVVFFHLKSASVLFTDLIQQHPSNMFSGWRAVVAKLDLMVGFEPSVPRKFRLAFTNRRAARDSLGRIFAWPAKNVLMAHGTPIEKDAAAFLRRAFGWLTA
jgi:hypothetical protein